jgi:gliding motility-associated-like protein
VLAIQVDSVNCYGYQDGEIAITASNGTPIYEYSVNGSTYSSTSVYSNLNIGTYTIAVRDANGCSVNAQVVVAQPDSLIIHAVADTVYQVEGKDNFIEVTSTSSNATYSWSPATVLDCSTCPKTKVNDLTSTLHTVTAQITPHNKACYGYASVYVLLPYKEVYVLPTAFSPNGDGNNDKYYPIFFGPDLQGSVVEFRIYDRWGQLLYNNPNDGWDGKSGGVDQPVETYTYFVKILLPDPSNPGKQREVSKTSSFALMR